jgi:hypothetical protein
MRNFLQENLSYPYKENVTIYVIRHFSVNLGIGKCGNVCGDRVWQQNPPGNNVTNFTKSYDFNWTHLLARLMDLLVYETVERE